MSQAGLLLHHVLFEAAQLAAEVVQLPRVEVTVPASVLRSSLEPPLTSVTRLWGGCHLLVMILLVILIRHEVKLSSQ